MSPVSARTTGRAWAASAKDPSTSRTATGRTLDDFCQDAADIGDANTVISDLGGKYEAKNKGSSLIANWDLNDKLSLKSISAWRYTDAEQDDELDHVGIVGTFLFHATTGRRVCHTGRFYLPRCRSVFKSPL